MMEENLFDTRKEKKKRVKKVIGVLLLIAVLYFVFTNFGLTWPTGFIVHESEESCVEVKGPDSLKESYQTALQVTDTGFKVMLNENKAVLNVENTDNVTGDVRVILYCVEGDRTSEQTKTIDSGETVVFNFLGMSDCDLDYIMYPDMVTRERNVAANTRDRACD